MNPDLQYAKYLIRHKWFVYKAGRRLSVPLWRLIKHDWSKLFPCEWGPYRDFFYGSTRASGLEEFAVRDAFDKAWRHHQRVNSHHWQYWLLTSDHGEVTPIEMPEVDVREMAADWMGAGRAVGKPDTKAYYQKMKSVTTMHPDSRRLFEQLIGYYE